MISTTISEFVADVDSRRELATSEINQESRSDLGQFLTPISVATLMAKMFAELPTNIRLLDAGAGTGGLTAALVAEMCARRNCQTITATAFETDDIFISYLSETYAKCKMICTSHRVKFVGDVRRGDFIEAAVNELKKSHFSSSVERFNIAIMNPPYRKIRTASHERRLVQRVGVDVTNLYAAFVTLAIRLLDQDGQLVAIIPRSFCNGAYFKSFREMLLKETTLLRIHMFESRKDVFRDDGVLQENIIIHVRKSKEKAHKVIISLSSGSRDESVVERLLPHVDIVRTVNDDQFIHLPKNADDDRISRWITTLPETLKSIGLSVSTGRVVAFRAKSFLRPTSNKTTAPLIWPHHFSENSISWPKLNERKPDILEDCAETRSLLIPRGYYVLVKRISSKEERRRLVAAVYDPEVMTAPLVGFENHLNYFHRNGKGLDREEALGLCAFLNSESIDNYFRQFNGHTQVNATDLRSLRYPSLNGLCALGVCKLMPGTPELEAAVCELYPFE